MKIQCPGCDAKYNIDSSKIPVIPEGAITTTCPKCSARMPISLNEKTPDLKQHEEKQNTIIIPCPQCGHINLSTKACVSCGRAFTKEELDNLKIAIGGD